jgi:hypothetical protein
MCSKIIMFLLDGGKLFDVCVILCWEHDQTKNCSYERSPNCMILCKAAYDSI